MSQNLPPLMPQQEQSPTFNLSATKYAMVNPIYNAIKNIVPSNMRMLGKSIFNPSNINEGNFSQQELDTLRDAYINSGYRANSPEANIARVEYQKVKQINPNAQINFPIESYSLGQMPASDVANILERIQSRGLQYDDYPYKKGTIGVNPYGTAMGMVKKSFNDKAYAMANTLGRANYYKDSDGNIHVIDSYNFNKLPKGTTLNSEWSPTYKALHFVGENLSKTMPVDINLGQMGNY